jgi:hypothetical protein
MEETLKYTKLDREVFDKESFKNTINTNFEEFGEQPLDPSFFDINLATIEDFFNLYDKLFFEIPKFGESNSHEYLINTSKDYIGFEETQELVDEINDLLEEINELRIANIILLQEKALGTNLSSEEKNKVREEMSTGSRGGTHIPSDTYRQSPMVEIHTPIDRADLEGNLVQDPRQDEYADQ